VAAPSLLGQKLLLLAVRLGLRHDLRGWIFSLILPATPQFHDLDSQRASDGSLAALAESGLSSRFRCLCEFGFHLDVERGWGGFSSCARSSCRYSRHPTNKPPQMGKYDRSTQTSATSRTAWWRCQNLRRPMDGPFSWARSPRRRAGCLASLGSTHHACLCVRPLVHAAQLSKPAPLSGYGAIHRRHHDGSAYSDHAGSLAAARTLAFTTPR
jgi:hypothetical protein